MYLTTYKRWNLPNNNDPKQDFKTSGPFDRNKKKTRLIYIFLFILQSGGDPSQK